MLIDIMNDHGLEQFLFVFCFKFYYVYLVPLKQDI